MQEYNDKLLSQIALFRKLETMENIGITFDEMKCESVIHKLSAIEENPDRIWAAFDTYYSPGFFYGQIELEFGITPDTHDQLVNQFD